MNSNHLIAYLHNLGDTAMCVVCDSENFAFTMPAMGITICKLVARLNEGYRNRFPSSYTNWNVLHTYVYDSDAGTTGVKFYHNTLDGKPVKRENTLCFNADGNLVRAWIQDCSSLSSGLSSLASVALCVDVLVCARFIGFRISAMDGDVVEAELLCSDTADGEPQVIAMILANQSTNTVTDIEMLI